MEFVKYQHVERYGTTETEGIEFGEVYVFPKIDGANGSVWMQNGEIQAASRRHVLTVDDDNQGFCAYIKQHDGVKELLKDNHNLRLYGEWLVPHSFKGYRPDAWRKFYVFDVCDDERYIPYPEYEGLLGQYGIDYIPPICVIKNGNHETFLKATEKNTFLVEDGQGVGEGVVLKNYNYQNRYGRQTWAKIVRNEFKEKHVREMGVPEVKAKKMVEEAVVEEYCTSSFIEKEYAKIVNSNGGWSSKNIPELLGRVFSELVREEAWNFVKQNKYPTINFKTLNQFTVNKIKEVKPELF